MTRQKPDIDDSAQPGTADVVPDVRAESQAHLGDASQRAALISMLEGEIVPRLLMLDRSAGACSADGGSADADACPDDVDELAGVLLGRHPALAREVVQAVRERGVPDDRICSELLMPVAHRLADLWESHELGYQQLALGLEQLRTMVLEIGGAADGN